MPQLKSHTPQAKTHTPQSIGITCRKKTLKFRMFLKKLIKNRKIYFLKFVKIKKKSKNEKINEVT